MYFSGEKLNAADVVLAKVPAADRARVVITAGKSNADALPLFAFDITIAKV
jgi:protocatechuate 3,4-dioxygenase beta subunit